MYKTTENLCGFIPMNLTFRYTYQYQPILEKQRLLRLQLKKIIILYLIKISHGGIMRTIQTLQNYFIETNDRFLTGLYRELLNRELNSREFSIYKGFLDKGDSKIEILKYIVKSEEFAQLINQARIIQVLHKIMCKDGYEFIKLFYQVVLGKVPTLQQIQETKEKLLNDVKSIEEIVQKILLSEEVVSQIIKPATLNFPEYSVLNKLGTIIELERNDCVSELFLEFINDPSIEIDLIKDSLIEDAEITNISVYIALINSLEFSRQFNHDLSLNCLQRLQGIMKLTNEEFLTEVYRECLDREPDSEGYTYYMNTLKNGTTKLDVLVDILLSREASDKLHHAIEPHNKQIQVIEADHINSNQLRTDMAKILDNHHFSFETNIIVKSGGLGDFIQMTPVAKALKAKYPDYPIVVALISRFGKYGSIFDEHPYIDLTVECVDYGLNDSDVVNSLIGLVENVFDVRYVSRVYGKLENVKFACENVWYYDQFPFSGSRLDDLNMHVSDLMLHSLGLEQYGNCNDVCVSPDEVPEEIPGVYVVVSNSLGSIASQIREWLTEEWDELIKWLNSIGVIPVQLGSKSDKLLHFDVMDLRGQTTIRQAAAYLKQSKGYIGVEGGLFHLSKAVGVSAVVIFASTSPICFAYPDTRVVTKNTCRPCWWNGPWYTGKCIRGCNSCLNLPDWESVADEVTKMLNEGREI